MNKKELYESIVKSVAKEVKKALNESFFDDIKAKRINQKAQQYKEISYEQAEKRFRAYPKQLKRFWNMLGQPIVSDFLISDLPFASNTLTFLFNIDIDEVSQLLEKIWFEFFDDEDAIKRLGRCNRTQPRIDAQSIFILKETERDGYIAMFVNHPAINIPELREAGYRTYLSIIPVSSLHVLTWDEE